MADLNKVAVRRIQLPVCLLCVVLFPTLPIGVTGDFDGVSRCVVPTDMFVPLRQSKTLPGVVRVVQIVHTLIQISMLLLNDSTWCVSFAWT